VSSPFRRCSFDSSHPYRQRVATKGPRASRRDGRYMSSKEKRKSATSGEDRGGPQSQSRSPAPQTLVEYEGRLVPIEISRDLEGSENVARSSPPSFVEGSSRSGVGWRQAILSGTARESDFEEGDSLARMEVAGDWIE